MSLAVAAHVLPTANKLPSSKPWLPPVLTGPEVPYQQTQGQARNPHALSAICGLHCCMTWMRGLHGMVLPGEGSALESRRKRRAWQHCLQGACIHVCMHADDDLSCFRFFGLLGSWTPGSLSFGATQTLHVILHAGLSYSRPRCCCCVYTTSTLICLDPQQHPPRNGLPSSGCHCTFQNLPSRSLRSHVPVC